MESDDTFDSMTEENPDDFDDDSEFFDDISEDDVFDDFSGEDDIDI